MMINAMSGSIKYSLSRHIAACFLAGLVVWVTGCESDDPTCLTESDNGTTVQLTNGDQLEVRLQGNPTTGYTWALVSPASNILTQTEAVEYRSNSSDIGSGGEYIYRFRAIASGQASLKLIYRRSFENNQSGSQIFEVSVIVVND